MKKFLSVVLALVLICSMIPLSAAAVTVQWPFGPGGLGYVMDDAGNVIGNLMPGETWNPNDGDSSAEGKVPASKDIYHPDPRDHKLGWNSNTKYHWKECACGCKFGMELHVDPLNAEDDYCICGYHFSDNADLVTLWVNGCPPIKNFDKNKTEYKLNAYTYKDVKEIDISTRTFDSEATVELPEDLTLKTGENKFEVKVTSENQKVTKTYTLIITK